MSLSEKIFSLFFNLGLGIITAGIWFGVIIWQWIKYRDEEKSK